MTISTRTLHVLVVEDESIIREMVKQALEDGGFSAAVASSAKDAIDMLASKDAAYRALITDVNLGRDSQTLGRRQAQPGN